MESVESVSGEKGIVEVRICDPCGSNSRAIVFVFLFRPATFRVELLHIPLREQQLSSINHIRKARDQQKRFDKDARSFFLQASRISCAAVLFVSVMIS